MLQPQLVMVVVITSTGGVSKRLFAFAEPVDPGLAEWASEYLNERIAGLHLGPAAPAEPLRRGRAGRRASARSWRSFDPPSPTSSRPGSRPSTWAARPGSWTSFARTTCTPTGGCSRCSSSGQPSSSSCVRASCRSARSCAWARSSRIRSSRSVSLVSAPYGLRHRNLGTVSLLGPTRMDYVKAIDAVRSAAHELSRFVEEMYEE